MNFWCTCGSTLCKCWVCITFSDPVSTSWPRPPPRLLGSVAPEKVVQVIKYRIFPKSSPASILNLTFELGLHSGMGLN